MPLPGDQHQPVTNPFEEHRLREYTASEAAALQQRLERKLGPEFLSSRPGPSGKAVHYLAAEKCISLANQLFGFNGWSSSIQNIQVDYVDEHPQTMRISLGISVAVRVTLRDGTFHEDLGYGKTENCKGKAVAFEKAKKEATTDALKRALRHFGNVLGNCIYDAEYVKRVTKINVAPTRFVVEDLHRHPDFVLRAPVPAPLPPAALKAENRAVGYKVPSPTVEPPADPTGLAILNVEPLDSFDDFIGDFDEADFCVSNDGHPDEIVVPILDPPADLASNRGPSAILQTPLKPEQRPAGPHPPPTDIDLGSTEQKAFFSARAVSQLPEAALQPSAAGSAMVPRGMLAFNPLADSPSIRKTAGIDHSVSKPVNRHGQHVASGTTTTTTPVRAPGNLVNPQLDHMRRVGAPPAHGASPLANLGQYRPPTMKRPPDGGSRVALAEMTANATVLAHDGPDVAKRQRSEY